MIRFPATKHWHRRLSLFLAVALMAGLFSGTILAETPSETPTQASGGTQVRLEVDKYEYTVNGRTKTIDVAPFIDQGRTFVPVRFVAEEFGMKATWGPDDSRTEWVHLEKAGLHIEMTIGDRDILVIGENQEASSSIPTFLRGSSLENDPVPAGSRRTVTADVAPQIKDGRTVLPLRALGEILGADFDWGPRGHRAEWISFTTGEQPVEGHQVVFKVLDHESQQPLNDALVELGDRAKTTDRQGRAVFENVSTGTYIYTIQAEGYISDSERVRIEGDDEMWVGLEAVDAHEVIFHITDHDSDEPLKNALVELGDQSETTDQKGRVVFEDVATGTYILKASASGFIPSSERLEIDRDYERWVGLHPAGPTNHEVVFKVLDHNTDKPLQNALVELNDRVKKTDHQGRAVFNKVPTGTYLFTVSAEGYISDSERVKIDQDDEMWIGLQALDTHEVVFKVRDLETDEPLEDAQVDMDDRTRFTDRNGRAVFSRVPTGTHSFTVSAEGYYRGSDRVEINRDDEVRFFLEPMIPIGG